MSIDKVNLDLLGRVEELEILTSALLGERDAKGDLANLQTVYDDLVKNYADVKANLSQVRTAFNTETQTNARLVKVLNEMTAERDAYRQELIDLHDYVLSGGDHKCDMAPECPIMDVLFRFTELHQY